MASWLALRTGARAFRPECWFLACLVCGLSGAFSPTVAADPSVPDGFKKTVQPVLDKYCTSCHNAEFKKGDVNFDRDDPTAMIADQELWLKALKMLEAGMMPPKGKRRPSAEQVQQVEKWIKYAAFGIDPRNPDPGRVTIRRLNRTEYHNTIRDLVGVEFNAGVEFPADDTGHGFDNIGDVLTISPLLLEKYIDAAKTIVAQVVPVEPTTPAEKRIPGAGFGGAAGKASKSADGQLFLSYYKPATASYDVAAPHTGQYQVLLDLTASEKFVDDAFDYNKCRLVFKAGDRVLLKRDFSRQAGKAYHFEFNLDWKAGKQKLTLEVQPLTPDQNQVRSLTLRIQAVTVRGPMARDHWVRSTSYERFFPGGIPANPMERRAYARKLLEPFVTRAYRRPVDGETLDRLVRLIEATAAKPGQTFEQGVAQAMVVVLASPRFLFREEKAVPESTDRFPLIDEYSLASRLSYFLWSSTPDEELFRLAGAGKLRQNLEAQVTRMLADKRSGEFVRNFAGQWLQARGIDSANVNAAAVLANELPRDPDAEQKRKRFRELRAKDKLTEAEKKELEQVRAGFFKGFRRFARFQLTGELRRAMRQETEMAFEYLVKEDRSLLELIDANYTFLNQKLADYYGITGVTGDKMRKVDLPPDSPRGGILTQATVLILTSNPDRTSPVKRGLYILDNVLGLPPPPPPGNIPPLEQAAAALKGKTQPTLREALKLHRQDALCSSCHNRMDPLGLAFENFNALGRWRDKELGQPIEASGELLTGETFKNVRELKKTLVTARRQDFYRCATEKMLIYALGRGLQPQDMHTVDDIVEKLETGQGRPSVLIRAIVDAPAFQRRRPEVIATRDDAN
jgi:Protein of unknown function (DUF1592)/Protein of unknown function (DUF1588)/Protein of unknown function (DUF1587)/Protein of unknown function (DUF1585)/Protein of unknown function (DUF1595)